MALTKAKLIELIDNGDIDVGGGGGLADILLAIYPIGAIYQSTVSTSPATLFGGAWEAIPAGYFLRTGTGGATGGSDTHVHSTPAVALTIEQMPSHNHPLKTINSATAGGVAAVEGSWKTASTWDSAFSLAAGSGAAHGHGNTGSASNVPAYYAVYAWRRTA